MRRLGSALPLADPEVELAPGDRVDRPVPYGEVSCSSTSPAPDRAELRVDGRSVTVELPRCPCSRTRRCRAS